PDQDRYAATVDDELQDVESLPVGPEGMGTRGGLHRRRSVELGRIRSDEQRSGDRDEDEKEDDHEAGRRELVTEEQREELPDSRQIDREAFPESRRPSARFGDDCRRQAS